MEENVEKNIIVNIFVHTSHGKVTLKTLYSAVENNIQDG